MLVTEALSRQRQIVLLGGPGSGKSTFLRHLAMMLARAETQGQAVPQLPGWEAGLVLPLVASLGAYAAWVAKHDDGLSTDGLWRFLLASCEGVLLDGLAAQIKAAFHARRLVLLLDGLDEVADLALRAHVAAIVAHLGETPGLVVVTCRGRSFTGAVAAPFAAWGEAVHVAPFTLGQVRHFVHAWYQRGVAAQEITPAQATERADELYSRPRSAPPSGVRGRPGDPG